MLKAYQYFFYKTYKFIEYLSFPKFWTEWKTIGALMLIEVCLVNSINVCFHYFTGIEMDISDGSAELYLIFMAILLISTKFYVFVHKDKWKNIIKKYDKLPKGKVDTGGILVAMITLAIIASYFFCLFYVMGQLKYKID